MLKFLRNKWFWTRGFITGMIVTASTIILALPLLILSACAKAEEKETK